MIGIAVALVVALAVVGVAAALGAFRTKIALVPPDAGLRTGSATPPAGTAPTLDIRAALRAVEPGVVEIVTSSTGQGLGSTSGSEISEAQGTGMVLDTKGDVLTNAHLVTGAATISVRLAGAPPTFRAQVLGVDRADDVAVIRIQNPPALTPVPLGASSGLQVGDPVLAIGNALGLAPGGPSVTSGIISGLDRSVPTTESGLSIRLMHLVQTDAPIAPGDSGGPLVDASNQVVAMATFISQSANGSTAENIGFAIAIDAIKPLIPDLENGVVPVVNQGFLGVNVKDAQSGGALVVSVVAGSPAAKAGIRDGDTILGLNGQGVATGAELADQVSSLGAGKKVAVRYLRAGTTHTVTVTLATKPAASPSP